MDLYFFKFKYFGITYFMFFYILAIAISYILTKYLFNDGKIEKNKLEDIYFYTLIIGMISSRVSYFILNLKSYRNNILSIISINHFNTYLIGGVIGGLLFLYYYSRKNKIEFSIILSVLLIPFYFSVSIGIWGIYFDRFFITKIDKSVTFLLLSLTFFLGIILDNLSKKNKHRLLILFSIITMYYIIKNLLT